MKTAPTDAATYIEQMIATERNNQEQGFEDRIKELEEEKNRLEYIDKAYKRMIDPKRPC